MKNIYSSFLSILFAFTAILFLTTCKKESQNGFVHLHFNHAVGTEELVLNNAWYPCAAGHLFSVVRLKYYTSNFSMHRSDGTAFQVNEAHYRDAETPETESFTLKDVPNGEYTGLSFILGLDEAANVDGGLPNTTTNINMEWPLPGDQGYHYMKLEGKYDSLSTGVLRNFNLHTGATGGNQNYVEISLLFHHPMRLNGDTWNISLAMDLEEWLEHPHVYDFDAFEPTIMGNQDAQQALKENGADVFSVTSVERE
ncbi:MAG: hypothetical protein HY842_15515 [Bacteroidetes bacterium]|nr:hypothetical protein [Bacteroidota bacterium]